MVGANARMRAVKCVHLVDQPNAEQFVFRTGAAHACGDQGRDYDTHRNTL